MVKPKEVVEKKMRDRIATAGAYLKDAMSVATDPLDVLMADIEAKAKALQDGLADAIRRGLWQIGIKKAKERNAWRNAIDRAGRHYEEKADEIVERAMETYEERARCIEEAKKAIEKMPSATREQRIARSQEYLRRVAECFDRIRGVKK